MSPGLPPHPSQLLPGAGDGATGGLRRTPGKGRKAGGDVVGRKKFWGVTGKPGGSFGGDSEGEELGEEWRPLELRRLPLSGEVVALGSGDGSGCDPEAAREAFPLRISMTLRLRATMRGVSLWQFLRPLSAPLRTSVRTRGRSPRPDAECRAELPEYI